MSCRAGLIVDGLVAVVGLTYLCGSTSKLFACLSVLVHEQRRHHHRQYIPFFILLVASCCSLLFSFCQIVSLTRDYCLPPLGATHLFSRLSMNLTGL